MQYKNTTKNGTDSTSLDKKRTDVLYLPNVIASDRIPSSHARLVQLLKDCDPDAPVAMVMDILYKSIFNKNARQLREFLCLPKSANLRKALRRRSPVAYQYLCLAEEVLISDLERHLENTDPDIGLISRRAGAWFPAFQLQASSIGDSLKIDLVTGEALPDR